MGYIVPVLLVSFDVYTDNRTLNMQWASDTEVRRRMVILVVYFMQSRQWYEPWTLAGISRDD